MEAELHKCIALFLFLKYHLIVALENVLFLITALRTYKKYHTSNVVMTYLQSNHKTFSGAVSTLNNFIAAELFL